jgi:uncharacterized protein YkwD
MRLPYRIALSMVFLLLSLNSCGGVATAARPTPTFAAFPAFSGDVAFTPSPTPMLSAAGYADPKIAALVARAFNRTNMYHMQSGCTTLRPNIMLTRSALQHSMTMAADGPLLHVEAGEPSIGVRIKAQGYAASNWGENIAHWPLTPEQMMDYFFNEKPPNDAHRQIIMTCGFIDLGIGYYSDPRDPTYIYWTEDFGTPAH